MGLMRRRSLFGYLFIMPWLIGFAFLFLSPLLQTLLFSFSQVDLVPGKGFVTQLTGIGNYRYAFLEDEQFPRLLTGSIVGIFTDIPFLLIFSFFSAVLLRNRFRGSSVVKAIFFLTVILSSGILLKMQAETQHTIGSALSSAIYQGGDSIPLLKSFQLDRYLRDAGFPERFIGYITGPVNQLFTIISRSGVQVILFIAGLHSIPSAVYEACHIEGATAWESFWKITFPMMSPIILLVVVYSIIDSFTSYSNSMLNYIYTTAFDQTNFAYGGAMSWIYFCVIAAFLGLVTFVLSKRIQYLT